MGHQSDPPPPHSMVLRSGRGGVGGDLALALENLDADLGLVVRRRGEHLPLLRRDRRVARDEPGARGGREGGVRGGTFGWRVSFTYINRRRWGGRSVFLSVP